MCISESFASHLLVFIRYDAYIAKTTTKIKQLATKHEELECKNILKEKQLDSITQDYDKCKQMSPNFVCIAIILVLCHFSLSNDSSAQRAVGSQERPSL